MSKSIIDLPIVLHFYKNILFLSTTDQVNGSNYYKEFCLLGKVYNAFPKHIFQKWFFSKSRSFFQFSRKTIPSSDSKVLYSSKRSLLAFGKYLFMSFISLLHAFYWSNHRTLIAKVTPYSNFAIKNGKSSWYLPSILTICVFVTHSLLGP